MTLQHFNLKSIKHLYYGICVKTLGEGAFGLVEVYQCKQVHIPDIVCDQLFTIKRVKYTKKYGGLRKYLKESNIECFKKEYNIGILLDHKNIRKTFDIDVITNSIVFEYCSGIDLLDYANLYNLDNTRHLLSYFSQILEAISYLHDNSIAHLDLKLENIIVNVNTNVVKLIDFGYAVIFKNEDNQDVKFFKKNGTIKYLAPEIVNIKGGYYADKVDMWCCGVILYNLFYNRPLWEIADEKVDDIYKLHYSSMIKNDLDSFVFPISNKDEYYDDYEIYVIYNLFKMLLNTDPNKRRSIGIVKGIFSLIKFDKIY